MNESLQLSCVSVVDETPLVKVFRFRVLGAVPALSVFKPGRYVSLGFPKIEGSMEQRCYSIVRVDPPNIFEVAIQKSGRSQVADSLFHNLAVGDLLRCQSPAGSITADRLLPHKNILMLAGGIGVTLPMALIRELSARYVASGRGPSVRLILCTPTQRDTPFLSELLALASSSEWFALDVCLTRETQFDVAAGFHLGRPAAELFDALVVPDAVVICGSQSFARSMQQRMCIYPESEIMIEAFSSPISSKIEVENLTSAATHLQVQGMPEMIALHPGKSILEHLLEADISIAHQCRSGICGSCRIKLLGGGCTREADFALGEREREAGYVLACCTFPAGESMTIALQ